MTIISKLKIFFLPTEENKFCPVLLNNKAIGLYVALFLLINIGFGWSSILLRQTSLFANISSQAILNLTNKTRALHNLPPVGENSLLDKAAQEKAEDMIRNGYFGHFSPSGVSPWHWIKKTGYNYHYAGENLALNFIDSGTVMRAWLNSPSHRANLLDSHYKNIGIAVGSGDVYGDGVKRTFVVQVFGSQMATPSPSNNTGKIVFNKKENKVNPTPIAGVKENSIQSPTTTNVAGAESVSTSSHLVVSTTYQNSTNSPSSTNSTNSTSSIADNSTTISSSSPILLSSQQSKGIPEKQFLSLTKTLNPRPIKAVDEAIAGFMFLVGGINLWFVIRKPKKIDFRFPELAWRGVAIILLAVSFLVFNLSVILGGPLIIS